MMVPFAPGAGKRLTDVFNGVLYSIRFSTAAVVSCHLQHKPTAVPKRANPFRPISVHFGLFWYIMVHFGPFWYSPGSANTVPIRREQGGNTQP